jgi:hypothetical protein
MMIKTITTNLDRGLGNQLFTFHAGLYLGLRANSRVVKFDLTGIQIEKQVRKSAIDDFQIEILNAPFDVEWSRKFKSPNLVLLERLIHKFFKKYGITRKLMKQFRSVTYGFDPQLEGLKAPVQIWGNYQSWRYPSALAGAGIVISFQVKNPTTWYLELFETVKVVRPIAIHMRRGDYVNYASDLGLLSDNYYLGALKHFLSKENVEYNEIWIFSDSLEPANSLKAKIDILLENTSLANRGGVKVINPPASSTSAENLLLLSQASMIITSNSSWSWWASWIAGKNTHVIVPEPYYKAFEGEFLDHIPDHWERYPSEFL